MCWESSNIPIKKVAEKPIRVFKIGRKDWRKHHVLPYYNPEIMHYEVGRTYNHGRELTVQYESDYWMEDQLVYTIDAGFHSYNSVKVKVFKSFPVPHWFDVVSSMKLGSYDPIVSVYVECLIPKGSVYYENYYGEIVSDKIKIVKLKNIEDVLAH